MDATGPLCSDPPAATRHLLLLAALTLLFFAPLVIHPGEVLYSDSSDLLALHIPAKRFLVRSWQQDGQLPLWNPYSYGGAPFLHDIQGAVLYPPHQLLATFPEEWVGPALSWLVVLHVLIAGWTMYGYARSQDLGPAAALVAALGSLFAGRWLLHLLGGGHYVTIGVAWLPLLLLCLDRAVRRASLSWATAAGGTYALMILSTQPQWTFYAGLFAALWTLAPALESAGVWQTAVGQAPRLPGVGGQAGRLPYGSPAHRRTISVRRALGRWMLSGAWAAALAVGIGAAALLPALEAAGHSTRAEAVSDPNPLPQGLQTLAFLVGPTLTTSPANAAWEDRGGLGLLWLVAAMLAPLVGRGKVRYQAAVTAGLFLFACGGAILFQGLPGFRLFRQPARMLVIAGFPVAYLAGVTSQRLFEGVGPDLLARCRRVLRFGLLACAVLVGGFVLKRYWDSSRGQDLTAHVYWLSLLVTVPAALCVLRPAALPWRRLAWTTVLLADLWALAWPLVQTRPEADIFAPSRCVDFVAGKRGTFRVLDRDDDHGGTPLGTGTPLAPLYHLEAVRGYCPLDVRRFKEYLQMIADRDTPLRPFDDSGFTYPVIGSFPVRNPSLLDLLGVRYVLQPSTVPADQPSWKKVAEDRVPQAYVLDEGVTELPPFTVYENPTAVPRVFVIHEAAPLPDRPGVLAALKETDLRRKVLLETLGQAEPHFGSVPGRLPPRAAVIRSYRPNQVEVEVEAGMPGYLVLADTWFPGWVCVVEHHDFGHISHYSQPVYRADFLFRAVEVPPEHCRLTFLFRPESFRLGTSITGASLVVLLAVFLFAALRASRRRRAAPASGPTPGGGSP
jgi:hypothetical protein